MTMIRLYCHPFDASREMTLHSADSIGDWLLSHYGPAMPVGLRIFAGPASDTTEVTGDVEALARNDAPYYTVLETPGDPTGGILTNILINLAISTVISVIAGSWFAPDKPVLGNRTQESPNNALSNRDNRLRILERVEDIFGTVRAVPSVLMPEYTKYIGNKQVRYGLYCVGRGYYVIDNVREGQTPLDSITGSSAEFYRPFESPNNAEPFYTVGDAIIDGILDVARNMAVENVILKPLNQLQLPTPSSYTIRGAGPASGYANEIPASTDDIIYQPEPFSFTRRPNFSSIATEGQTLTIASSPQAVSITTLPPATTMTVNAAAKTYTINIADFFLNVVNGTSITMPGLANPTENSSPKTVVAHTGDTVTVAEGGLVDEVNTPFGTAEGFALDMTVDVGGVRQIASVGDGYVTLVGPAKFAGAPSAGLSLSLSITIDNDLTDWTDWHNLVRADLTQVWGNFVARGGLFKDDGTKSPATVEYELQIERLDEDALPTGDVVTVPSSMTGSTATEQAETLEHVVPWPGPVRVRARRTSLYDYDFAGGVVDEVTWTDLYAVAPITKPHFGNKTIVHTVTRASVSAAAIRNRQLNCLASRQLPLYEPETDTFTGAFDADGALASGTLASTSRIVDIIPAVAVDPRIGAMDIVDVDMAQIQSVQDALDAWHPEVGQFNHTFDSDQLSFEETLVAIADAAFCRPIRQNGVIRLSADLPQDGDDAVVALYTHKHKDPSFEETVTRTFTNDSDYDGVELTYVDPDTESQETIRLPLDLSATKYKRVEVSGIRSFAQAWFRANRELNRINYERVTMVTQVTTDARALLPNSKVNIVDNTLLDTEDGDVIAQDGLELTLSTDVTFVPGEEHSAVLTLRDGSVDSIVVTPGSAPNKVVLQRLPVEPLVTFPDPDEGTRTTFSFAANTARGAEQWLVRELELTDENYVKITCGLYVPEYYQQDTEPVPERDAVINVV